MGKQPASTEVRVKLPVFAVLVLRHRAKNQGRTIAEVIEALLWEDCYVDEMQTVAQESAESGLALKEWFRDAATRRK